MGRALPTLSSSGFVNGIAEKADRLMSYYFTSEASQSNLYRGEITSLPKQIQLLGNDESGLASRIRVELERLFGYYFDAVEFEVITDVPNPTDPNRINVTISATLIDNGQQYSLGRLINVVDSQIARIIDINNNQGA